MARPGVIVDGNHGDPGLPRSDRGDPDMTIRRLAVFAAIAALVLGAPGASFARSSDDDGSQNNRSTIGNSSSKHGSQRSSHRHEKHKRQKHHRERHHKSHKSSSSPSIGHSSRSSSSMQ
jgi:hypothetical protein